MVNSLLRRLDVILSVSMLVSLAALDVALGADTQINGAYAIAAVVAATLSSVRTTVIIGSAAVAASVLSGVWNDTLGSRDWFVRWMLCVALVGLSVAMATIRVQRERALLNMTVIAETAQRALLRALPDKLRGLRLSARYLSASDGASVGGDLYDVASTPYGVRVLVGDARGKGLDAVQMAGTVLGAFRRAAFERRALPDLAVDLDRVASAVAGDEDFVTALIAEIHDDGSVTLVNCGHHPPLLLLADEVPRYVDTGPPTRPLGLGSFPVPVTCEWGQGARLLLYTDGLVEARDPGGRFFSLLDHADVLTEGSVEEGLDALLSTLTRHTTTRLRDDLALLLIENCGRREGNAPDALGPAAVPIAR